MSGDETVFLFANLQQGSELAASEIFERYVHRLTALARSRLSPQMQVRVDADDIVQSVYRVFFDRARKDEFQIERSGDLWRLLAAIAILKIRSSVQFNQAQRRSFLLDTSLSVDDSAIGFPVDAVSHEPTPDESTALIEEVRFMLDQLDNEQRRILELRLQGASIEEIAEEIEKSPRTVRRGLEVGRRILEQRLLGSPSSRDVFPEA